MYLFNKSYLWYHVLHNRCFSIISLQEENHFVKVFVIKDEQGNCLTLFKSNCGPVKVEILLVFIVADSEGDKHLISQYYWIK